MMGEPHRQMTPVPYGAWRQYAGHQLVYFLQAPEGGPIHLGHTGKLQARFRELEREVGEPLVIRRTMRFGSRHGARLEADHLALRFARAQLSPGLFRATPELAAIAKAHPEPVLGAGERLLAASLGLA